MLTAAPSNGRRYIALAAVAAGAIDTILFQRRASSHSHSLLLITLFAVWGLAPFAALLWFNLSATAWPPARRATLYLVTLIIAIGSFAIYAGGTAGPPRLRPAAPFLMVPVGCWALILITRAVAGRRSA